MPLKGLLADQTWLRKDSLNLRISQQKPPKLKSKEEKKSVSKDFRTATKGATHTMVVTSGKRKRNKGNI